MSDTCDVIRIKKKRLCAGDLRNLVQVLSRDQVVGSFDSVEPEEIFVEIAKSWMAIKTVAGKSIVSGIQVLDDATHMFFCRYTPALSEMDITKTFFLWSGKYYRVLKLDKINEDNLALAIQCALRGDSTKAAAEA
jgi:hypothetical protein